MADIKGLIDLGATDCFMSPNFIKRMKLGVRPLHKPQKIWNIDNTENKAGSIMHYVDLNVQTKHICRDMRFLITNIGNKDIIMGYPWLSMFKPQFNWTHAVINEQALPIVIQSVNPHIPGKESIVAGVTTGDVKLRRLHESGVQATTSTDLVLRFGHVSLLFFS